MGTTFVNIGDKGFWMRDHMLELWLRLLALHLEDPVVSGSAAITIRDKWLLASRGYFNGYVPHCLDEAISSVEGRLLVENAVHSLMKALSEGPDYIAKDVLNLMGFSQPFADDIAACRLIEVGNAFLDLMAGKIVSDASHVSFMPGSQ
jgi:hypothetical protein